MFQLAPILAPFYFIICRRTVELIITVKLILIIFIIFIITFKLSTLSIFVI